MVEIIVKVIEKYWLKYSVGTAFFCGLFATIISYIISQFLFRYTPHLIGITTIFFTVLFIMPLLTIVLKQEERLERKKGHFFLKNEKVIDFYVYFFFGVFLVFFLISFLQPTAVFSKENFYNIQPSVDSTLKVNLPAPSPGLFVTLKQILHNNLYLMLVAFILSLLFGTGSIFLIVLNASMGAAVLSSLIVHSDLPIFGSLVCQSSIFSIHFIPEMIGYLIAALAGGLLMIDFAKEKLFSKSFDEVFFDSVKLLFLAVFFIVISGILEVFISSKLFMNDFCVHYPFGILFIFLIFICGIIFFERLRKNRSILKKKNK